MTIHVVSQRLSMHFIVRIIAQAIKSLARNTTPWTTVSALYYEAHNSSHGETNIA